MANDKAFVLIHFGSNKKYLEYELYVLMMLKTYSKMDIVYMYSINDTPATFIEIIGQFGIEKIKFVPYDDNKITYNVDYDSIYKNFNTLRTCNFLFALKLLQYDLICLIESDMILSPNIDKVFDFNSPSVFCYHGKGQSLNPFENYKISIEKDPIRSVVNGGVLLVKPSRYYYQKCIEILPRIIKLNSDYPNEILIMSVFRNKIHNLPVPFNYSKYSSFKITNAVICHYNGSTIKPLDVIKDKQINNTRRKHLIPYLNRFKTNFYDRYHKMIDGLIGAP